MRKSRFTEAQIIGIIKEQEAGMPTAEVCRKHGLSSATFYKLKAKYGGMEVSDAARLPMSRRGRGLCMWLSSSTSLPAASLGGASAAQQPLGLSSTLWNKPFINADLHTINWCTTRIADRNICLSSTLNGWQRRRLPHLSAALEIPMTMPWQKPSTGCSKPRSSTGASHGAVSTPWNTRHCNGSIPALSKKRLSSTTAACSSPSGISRQLKPRQTSTQLWKDQTWPRN
ncbi:Transposase [Primorskyibacter flagellatus]|uniref:Transposase n=1 Tax=Primorskyibacter flagellatus TaxID=1387277 RepID=A0A1W2EWI2_9RHOB|nr:Transposase [Primorskyibacter flagellatus]